MQPQIYERQTDFTERSGDDTDHSALNQEFDAAATSINEIRDNLELIQKDDGALVNGIVTADALAQSAFDAVQASVNAATAQAQTAANSAITSATTALGARDASLVAKTAAETSQAASQLNAASSATSAQASQNSATAAAASRVAAQASEVASASSQVAAAASSASATTSAATATTQAGIATTKAGEASASATNSASSAAASSTQATAAANSAADSLASKNAAATSATSAATQAAASSSSATTASAQATISTNKAAEAASSAASALASQNAASSSQTSSATSATTATTKASEAAASATASATSASASSSSASSAATAKSAAEAARDATLAALDSFDDRYLGQKANGPSVDNDGNTLLAGALYFNTTTNEMKVWDGAQWLNAYASLSGALLANSNLSDLQSKPQARTNLGLATVAASGSYVDLTNKPTLGSIASQSSVAFVGQDSVTGAAAIPTGTTAERPATPSAGFFRFNSTSNSYEGYNPSLGWSAIGGGGGATGGAGNAIFVENDKAITASYTITANKNAASAGPLTMGAGVVVTVNSGSVWTVS